MNFSQKLHELFPQGLTGIVFDCDGVMIDSEEANRFFYNSILEYLGLPPMTPEQEKFSFMDTAIRSLQRMTPASMHDRIEDAIAHSMNYEQEVLPRTRLMPGFSDFIEKAHNNGLRLAIDTNRTPLGIERILDFFALPDYFDPIVSSLSAEPKPSPEGVLLICKAWDTAPDRVLFLGDSDNDCKAAHAAGAVFIAYGGNVQNCDAEVRDYAELGKGIWTFLSQKNNQLQPHSSEFSGHASNIREKA